MLIVGCDCYWWSSVLWWFVWFLLWGCWYWWQSCSSCWPGWWLFEVFSDDDWSGLCLIYSLNHLIPKIMCVRRSFVSVLEVVPLADTITKLTARCELCRKRAFFTLRKTQETKTELIGGADVYMPVCRQHYVNLCGNRKTVLKPNTVQCSSWYGPWCLYAWVSLWILSAFWGPLNFVLYIRTRFLDLEFYWVLSRLFCVRQYFSDGSWFLIICFRFLVDTACVLNIILMARVLMAISPSFIWINLQTFLKLMITVDRTNQV